MSRISAPDLVHAQVAALFGHLRGHDQRAPRVHPSEDGAAVVAVVGDAPDAERLQDDGIVVALEQVEDARIHLGRHLEHEHALVEAIVRARRSPDARARRRRPRPHDALAAHERDLGEVHAGERVEAHRALLARPRAGYHRAAEHHRHVARAIVGREQQALVQVELRIGEGTGHRLLRAGQHDGLRAALHQVGQRGGRVGHRVGAVQHHEPVVGVVGVHDLVADAHPVGRAHVRAVDVHGLHHVEVAHIRDLGHVARQLLAAQRRRQAASVLDRCDGAARRHQQYLLHTVAFLHSTALATV